MKENLLVLKAQVKSASAELQKLKAWQKELILLAAIRSGRICNWCHRSGHTKTSCKARPCESGNNCKIREKHSEIKNQISSLQAELKALQKQQAKQKTEVENFMAARKILHECLLCYVQSTTNAKLTQIHRLLETG